ncbi:MAG: hypothetical protein JST24_06075 [Acidobacteria bacterium]|nr:hypothetical protein [Acidobacteriota bacterium]
MPFFLLAPPALSAPQSHAKAKPKAAEPAAAPAPKMDGDWSLSVNDSDSISTHIEGAIANMSFFQKQLWKRKLAKACLSYNKLFILTGFANSISFDKEAPINLSADGTAATWTRSDDEKFQASLQKSPTGFVMILQGDGYTLNERMSVDGDTLTISISYVNPKLPDTFSYKQVYKRND